MAFRGSFQSPFSKNCSSIPKQRFKSLHIEGKLQTRKWKDKNGSEYSSTEIVLPQFKGELYLLDAKKNQPASPAPSSVTTKSYAVASGAADYSTSFNDSIPF
ncbi:Helix-destabilizing protein [Candidatus Bartonella washoeensis]|uniref:Single-stranded DNA-binding protein n=1 Tax=Candidatus Bartonella washoeensis Sb944nv TaxID=1094563 RepID=J0Q5M6_9HYPH|nr:hypothetical protein MCQ_01352 [Bartonella washoeensis Sb944nv]SPU27570.1 Helix-destabilizing protein [Bartonella washoeensis]